MKITFDNMDEFGKTLKNIQKKTEKSTESIVKQASLQFLTSIRARTPKASANVKKPNWGKVKDKALLSEGKNYFVKRYNKQNKLHTLYAYDRTQADKLRKIRYHGAAKNVWTGVRRKMGLSGMVKSIFQKVVNKASGYKKGGKKFNVYMELSNSVDYINKIVNRSKVSAAMRAANKKLKSRYKKKMGIRV